MILIVESSRPFSGSTGGSFRSLQALAECLQKMGEPVCASFYFHNDFISPLNELGIRTIILKYKSPYHQFMSLMGKQREGLEFQTGREEQIKKTRQKSLFKLFKNVKIYGQIYRLLQKKHDIFLSLINIFPLLSVIYRTRAEIIYCNTGVTIDRAAIIAALIARRKVICHLRNLPTLSAFDRFLIKRIDATVSISHTVAKHYDIYGGPLPPTSVVLPNSLGGHFECAEQLVGPQITAAGMDFCIGCFSRLIEWKGVLNLIDGFARFRALGGEGIMRFYGDGPLLLAMKERAAGHGIGGSVIFERYTPDVISAMRACSVVVSPSIRPEPLGRVLMEAMYLGIPVLASNHGGHLEIIDPEETGILFKAGDADAIARALKRLYDQPKLRLELAVRAMAKSEQWMSKNYLPPIQNLIQEVRKKS